jgi:galactonate dehydratase
VDHLRSSPGIVRDAPAQDDPREGGARRKAGDADVKITKVEPILYDAGDGDVWCFVRVETDEGITGIGESSTTEPYMAAAVAKRLAEWVVGRDPRRIQEFWQLAYRRHFNVRGGNLLLAAISGIEHALWDIKGKLAGLPVYELLGGAMRTSVPVYIDHVFFRGIDRGLNSDPAPHAERAAAAVERGYRAIKFDPFGGDRTTRPAGTELRHARAWVKAVRDAVGPDVELGVDAHTRFGGLAEAARACRTLEDFDLFFMEDPLPPENFEAWSKLRQMVSIPLATGERTYTKWGFRDLLAQQAVEFIQPDIAHCGGILELRLIAAQAEAHYVQVMPHHYYGPVSLTAALHLDATLPNLAFQELPWPFEENVQRRELLTEPLPLVDGRLPVPTGAGLGISFNEEVLQRFRVQG